MGRGLTIDVEDLIGHPEARREFNGEHQARLRLGDTAIVGNIEVQGLAKGTVDGVLADFTVSAPAHFFCVRCLIEWDGVVGATGSQHFTRIPDEDGYAIEGRHIDIAGPATDELALAMPAAPVCRSDCKGLCSTCGTDLNESPCGGHGEDTDSPFAVLRDLFDS